MKSILYISTAFPKEGESATIYTDLAEALVEYGLRLTVVATEEKKNRIRTEMFFERGCNVLRVATGNHYNVGFVEKGITYIRMGRQIISAINSYLSDEQFDMILFSAPPVTMSSVVSYAKKKFHACSFLMMKDIFPQNAVDLGIMRKNGIVYKYFRHKEQKMYEISDIIGCMSDKNIEYLVAHNEKLKEKCIYFPNTKKINYQLNGVEKEKIRKEYHLPLNATVFVFGGNMGKPQGISYLCHAIRMLENQTDAFFVLVGRGTEKKLVEEKLIGCKNVLIMDNLERKKYEQLIRACDVGIVSLNYNFSIPNYPSRILSYMEYAMPVLAATDSNTDFRELVVKEAQCGIWCASNNVSGFTEGVKKLLNNSEERINMGIRGRRYLEEHFQVEHSVFLLQKYLKEDTTDSVLGLSGSAN